MKKNVFLLFTICLFTLFFTNPSSAQSCPLATQQAYKTDGSSSVYYVTENCTKRAFNKTNVFFTYFDSWSEVKIVSSTVLHSITTDLLGFMPWGPKYDPKYGALVKTVNDPKVYLLLGNEKYWITSENVFNGLSYFWNWIEDVDQRLLDKYQTASEINYTNHHPNYTLIKYTDNAKVYRLEPDPNDSTKQVKRYIQNETEFNSLGFRWDRIVVINNSEQYSDKINNVSSIGCQYSNPSCGINYDCINNQCLLKSGCQYNNPACSNGNQCTNNQCIIPLSTNQNDESLYFSSGQISGKNYLIYQEPSYDFRIVCEEPCLIRRSLIKAQYQGAKLSIEEVTDLVGLFPLDGPISYQQYYSIKSFNPVDIHLNNDSECGDYESARNKGISAFTSERKFLDNGTEVTQGSYICTFKLEKSQKGEGLPFTEEIASTLKGDPGIVHEFAHDILFGRTEQTHDLVIPITDKILKHITSDSPPITTLCDENFNRQDSGKLIYLLCKKYGFDFKDFITLFKNIDNEIHKQWFENLPLTNYYRQLTTNQFKKIFDQLLGVNTLNEFLEAGYSADKFYE